jgi:hypothetical protein
VRVEAAHAADAAATTGTGSSSEAVGGI